jgi:hypothetical protein
MTSLEIFRHLRKKSVNNLIKEADLNKQTYYNFISGNSNISHQVIQKFDQALDLDGFLHLSYLFDRLHSTGIRLDPDQCHFPSKDKYQVFIHLMLNYHPIFSQN